MIKIFLTCLILVSVLARSQNITAAEYFFDADPGVGNGSPISIISGTIIQEDAVISTAALTPGFHTLCIRTRDDAGVWGLYESRPVYISHSAAPMGDITEAEYFIDTDPGPGNGNAISIGTGGGTVNFSALLPSTSLVPGMHSFGIRTKNTDGQWSLFELRPFYISTTTGNMGNVVGAEYFIDHDPGIGNGIPLAINTPGLVVSENYIIPVSAGISNGQHYMAIRTRDVDDNWTLFEIDSFTVTGALPLHWNSFNAERKGKSVLLEWITMEEQGTSYFEVQRSANGIHFSTFGLVHAKSAAYNEYGFIDSIPLKGVNFYRLKQVDSDGSFGFSSIVRILFSGQDNSMVIYPNPVKNELRIDMPGPGNKVLVQLYDAGGRIVRTVLLKDRQNLVIQVGDLPAGIYRILISDGINSMQGSFIR